MTKVINCFRGQYTKWLGQLERQYSQKITQTQIRRTNIQNLSNYVEQIDSTIAISNGNNISKDSGT